MPRQNVAAEATVWMLSMIVISLTVVAILRIPILSIDGASGKADGAGTATVKLQTLELVWWYGWLTCASTALGVVPLLLLSQVFGGGSAQAQVKVNAHTQALSQAAAPFTGASPRRRLNAIAESAPVAAASVTAVAGDLVSSRSVPRARSRGRRATAGVDGVAPAAVRLPRRAGSTGPGAVVNMTTRGRVGMIGRAHAAPASAAERGEASTASSSTSSSSSHVPASTSGSARAPSPGKTIGAAAAHPPVEDISAARSGPNPPLTKRLVAYANAVAAGMMLAASLALGAEGVLFEPGELRVAARGMLASVPPIALVATGAAAGLLFVRAAGAWLEKHEDLSASWHGSLGAGSVAASAAEAISPTSARALAAATRRVLLIVSVMTLHSLAEGVGLGVSFGAGHATFGPFISAALAVHNVPEGMLIASQLLPRGVPAVRAALWCVLTSLPQPLMALPAFASVRTFAPLLGLGLGFAAGAMSWVATVELLPDACAELGHAVALGTAAIASLVMAALQALLK